MISLNGSLLLVGCGKMGGALLRGWLKAGIKPSQIAVFAPRPADWLLALTAEGLHVNEMPEAVDAVVVATKPQAVSQVLDGLSPLGNGDTLFVSIAAGTPIQTFQDLLGPKTPVVRAMPNTPAAIGAGITALIASPEVNSTQSALSEALMQAVGKTVLLSSEEQMHAVTALSGSGPAYVFSFAEAMIDAGCNLGLSRELATELSITTVYGASRLMNETCEPPKVLREEVTSPAGTTQAGLEVLLGGRALNTLVHKTLKAASARSRALS